MSLITNARSDIMRNENSYYQLASTGPNDSQKPLELQSLAADAHLKCALIHRLLIRLRQLAPGLGGPSGMNHGQPQPPQQNNESALLAANMGQSAGAPGVPNFNQAGQLHSTAAAICRASTKRSTAAWAWHAAPSNRWHEPGTAAWPQPRCAGPLAPTTEWTSRRPTCTAARRTFRTQRGLVRLSCNPI
ncbi:hypothetical protein BKA62DRAFT_687278 [Auriculariales sp. MPI-PUGE-AT-0066]|nr:hypothetical protein BKA62DRAFT_687278 [Auriculariales sp. MPI-PUGE-AT-0066]